VVDRDPLDVEPSDLAATRVLLTVVDGVATHS